MNLRKIEHEEFKEFEKICAPWLVEDRLRREVPRFWANPIGNGFNAFKLKDIMGYVTEDEYERQIQAALNKIWSEISETTLSKTLTDSVDYRTACSSFERKIDKSLHENDKTRKRITFRYVTGLTIYTLGPLQRPVRILPNKRKADRIINQIDTLLAEMESQTEFALWADYRLRQMLKELKENLKTSRAVPKVRNSLSPEGYFVSELAQQFVQYFGEPMPVILGDLCRVIGTAPDESTITRWVASALEHRKGDPRST